MKVPGRAWLQFEVAPHADGATITQTAIFDPLGFAGQLYWYGIYPIHKLIFHGMLNRICDAAMQQCAQSRSDQTVGREHA